MNRHLRKKTALNTFLGGAALVVLIGMGALVAMTPGTAQATVPAPTLKDLNFALRQQAPKILAELKKRGYHNVGVLKFGVQVDGRTPTLHAGRLNQQLATRLENSLVLTVKDADKVGIARSASFVAAKKDHKATYLNPKGRSALFQNSYPLAWGNKSTPVDAFLTGVVSLDTKNKVGKAWIRLFDRNNTAKLPEVVTSFTFKLTTSTLAESGQRYVVPRSTLLQAASSDQIDTGAQTPSNPGTIGPVDNDLKKLLDFRIFYDGQEVPLTPDASTGYLRCDAPPAGTKEVVYKLRAAEKLGLVLMTNGVNTLMMEKAPDRPLDQHARWVLEPNQDYTLRGFYPNFKTYYPFKVQSPDGGVDPGDMGPEDKWGFIELTLFRAPGNPNTVPEPSGDKLQSPDVSAPDLRSLQTILSKTLTARAKNLIAFDKSNSGSTDIPEVNFNAVQSAGLTIQYWDREALPK
jgi:hypothetical protein